MGENSDANQANLIRVVGEREHQNWIKSAYINSSSIHPISKQKMENVRQMLNRPEVRNLNCIRDVKFPVNYSLQSVEMKPTEEDPGLVSLTIRIPGEVRVVHGSEDVFGAVKEAVKKHINTSDADNDGLTIQEKQGAWVLKLEKGIFGKKQGVEVRSWKQLLARPDFGNGIIFLLQLLCQIMENITKAGYDMLTSSRFSTTPGYELRTWILKKAATPIENPQVMALAFPAADKVCVVGAKEDNPANPVVQAAIEKIMKPCETEPKETEETDTKAQETDKKEETKEDEEKEKETEEEKKDEDKKENETAEMKQEEETDNKDKTNEDETEAPVKTEETTTKEENKPEGQEDVKAEAEKESSDEKVNEFKLDMNQLNAENGKILRSKLLLEVLHQLFCRQWKLICSSHVPFGGDHEVMFFIQDTRILPGLGQDHFAMLEIEKPDMVRLYGLNEDMEGKIKTAMQEHWMPGLDSKDPEEVHGVKSYKLLEEPWNQSCVVKDGSGSMPRLVVSPQILVAKFLLAMNKAEMNVYESVTLDVGKIDQKTLVIFRQSNVSYSQELTLKLAGMTKEASEFLSNILATLIKNLGIFWKIQLSSANET